MELPLTNVRSDHYAGGAREDGGAIPGLVFEFVQPSVGAGGVAFSLTGVVLRKVGIDILLLVIGVIEKHGLGDATSAVGIIATSLRALFKVGGVSFGLVILLDENQDFGREVGDAGFRANAFDFNLDAVGE